MESQLTVALEEIQSQLAIEDLSGTLIALSHLLRAAERREREQGSSGTTWRVVSLHHSVPPVVIALDPVTRTAGAAVHRVIGTLRRIETGDRLNSPLTEQEAAGLV